MNTTNKVNKVWELAELCLSSKEVNLSHTSKWNLQEAKLLSSLTQMHTAPCMAQNQDMCHTLTFPMLRELCEGQECVTATELLYFCFL